MSGVNEDEQAQREEHALWMKNVRFLYDLVLSQGQTWPSLTLQWLPGKEEVVEQGYAKHRLLLGTHTSGTEQDYLMVAEAKLPLLRHSENDEDLRVGQERGGLSVSEDRITITQKIAHDGEVNRARYMPQRSHIVATKSPHADVCLFDLSAHPAKPAPGSKGAKPNARLTGHTAEGFGLSWSPFSAGRLLSGSNDNCVCIWDAAEASGKHAAALTLTKHTDAVNDVAWHQVSEHLFGSVGDDKLLVIWDERLPPETAATASVEAHEEAVNTLAFHPSHGHLVATGSNDKSVRLFDLRQLGGKGLHTLEGHTGEVFQVSWSPHAESVLASGARDNKVNLWDLRRIGNEQVQEDADDGPPELLLVHSGHSAVVEDLAWSPEDPWLVASIDNDNILQIWQPTEGVYQD